MRIVFAGTPEVALPAFEALLASSHEVVGVITRPDAPTGRGRKLRPSPVAQAAELAGVEVLKVESLKEHSDEVAGWLRDRGAQCVPVVAFGALVPEELLSVPQWGWVNLHFSLLPRWRGAAPVQAALLAGDEVTGVSVFQIEAGLDTGDVFARQEYPIAADATAGSLLEELAAVGAPLLVTVMDQLEAGRAAGHPQDHSLATVVGKISVEDARIQWDAEAEPTVNTVNMVRAMTPAPGAWTTLVQQDGQQDGQVLRFKVGPVHVAPCPRPLAVGEIVGVKNRVFVGCGESESAFVLSTVKAPGKKEMPAADWLRGARLEEGARFQ